MAFTTEQNKYGTNNSLTVERKISSQIKQRCGLDYPLTGNLNSVTGSVNANTNISKSSYFSKATGVNLIKNNLRQLLLCEKGERVMLPDYGLSLKKYLFEPLDETTYFLIRQDILETLAKYFSSVRVLSLTVLSNSLQRDRSELYISLTLQLLDQSLDIFDLEVTVD